MSKFTNVLKKTKSMWKNPLPGRFLCIKEIGALGIYSLGTSAFYNFLLFNLITIIFVPYFYKINSIHAYIILIAGNGLNMLFQPFFGNLMEKTKTKIGKYKPYIVGILPFVVAFTILSTYIPQIGVESGRIAYAYCTCVPTIFLITFIFNMYQTMPTVITPNGQERADIMTPIGMIFGLAPTILFVIIGPIRAAFAGREYMSMRVLGFIISVLGAGCMLFVLGLKERVVEIKVENEDSKITVWQAIKMLSKNKPLIIMSIALCLGSLREFWKFFLPMFGQTRFNSDVNIALSIMGIPMTIMGLGMTIGMLILPILTRKMDKKYVIMFLSIANLIICTVLGIVGFQRIPIGIASIVSYTILFLLSQTVSTVVIMFPMLIGEIADYQQSISGKRLEGHIQNFLLTIPLLFSQILMLGFSFLQKKIGYEPKDFVTDTMKKIGPNKFAPYSFAQQSIACNWFNIVCLISAGSTFLMIVVLMFYPLSRKKHQQACDKIKALAGEKDEDKENTNENYEILDVDITNQSGDNQDK